MKAKIEYINSYDEMKNGDCARVFEVHYTSGTVRKYENSYTAHIPASVNRFVDTASAVKLNSQVIKYVAQ